jgi:hypothetical protein
MSIIALAFASGRHLLVLIGTLNKDLAYLDPGSGSFILQILLATLLASLLFFKSFWRKVFSMFKKSPPQDPDENPDVEEEDPEDK